MLISIAISILLADSVLGYNNCTDNDAGICEFIEVRNRIQCGAGQVNSADCSSRGCCWDASAGPNCYMGNIAHKQYATKSYSEQGDLYPMSNALDGVDPTGTDLGHCAYLEWSRQTATIFLDGYYHVHAVTMYNKNDLINQLSIDTFPVKPTNPEMIDTKYHRCGEIGPQSQGHGEWIQTVCPTRQITSKIEIKSLYTSFVRPLYMCQIYVSGVKYRPECGLIRRDQKISCGITGVNSHARCLAAGCCHDDAEEPSCYKGNVAYGKPLTDSSGGRRAQRLTDGFSTEHAGVLAPLRINSSRSNRVFTIDLEGDFDIESVLIHGTRSHLDHYHVKVTNTEQVTDSTPNANCQPSALDVFIIAMKCQDSIRGRYITLDYKSQWLVDLTEIVVIGRAVGAGVTVPPTSPPTSPPVTTTYSPSSTDGGSDDVYFGFSNVLDTGRIDPEDSVSVMIPRYLNGWNSPAGTVIGWRVVVGRTGYVRLGFWRKVGNVEGTFKLIGSYDYRATATGVHRITLESDEKFDIQEGDVLGLEWRSGGVVKYKPYSINRCSEERLVNEQPDLDTSTGSGVYFNLMERCRDYKVQALVRPN